ncbi:hypothetical protein WA026_001494 [Henosepilachna vigintioctopunctata]|uniref:SHSP domain-containing protein n=1 Tax=Henosepilachna vigintioctopunctata TaxID=420089 RepID=A0AAW1UR50_9CUCU
MSLLRLLEEPLEFIGPSRLLDQHFGVCLDDEDIFSAPSILDRKLRRALLGSPYLRNWKPRRASRETGSLLSSDKNAFRVNLDVQQFSPEEITVKATGDNQITIEGKHEEKEDEHGYISRHFVRKYTIPKGHDITKVVSKLSSDGVLSITAPKVDSTSSVREIPIVQTGAPSRITEKNNEDDEDGVTQMDVTGGEGNNQRKK